MMYLKFYRAKVWKANNAVDTDISVTFPPSFFLVSAL